MTPENRNAFNAVLDELKRSICQSVGQDHESVHVIEQIESTLRHIEQKTGSEPFAVVSQAMTTTTA